LTNGAGATVATSLPQGSAANVRVAPDSSSPEALEGERKTVTALFADTKGSTELMEDLDPGGGAHRPGAEADDRSRAALRRLRRAMQCRRRAHKPQTFNAVDVAPSR
jgi:class 3 adenylate cyclase